jgi:Zeta toxin
MEQGTPALAGHMDQGGARASVQRDGRAPLDSSASSGVVEPSGLPSASKPAKVTAKYSEAAACGCPPDPPYRPEEKQASALPAVSTAQLPRITARDSAASSRAEPPPFVGPYSNTRAKLDYSYHTRPTVERQKVQDAIIARTLKQVRHRASSSSSAESLEYPGPNRKASPSAGVLPSPIFSPLLSSHASEWAFSKPPPGFVPTSSSSGNHSTSPASGLSPAATTAHQADDGSQAAAKPDACENLADSASPSSPSKSPLELLPQPWVLYTAGAMGSGKSRTLRYLHAVGAFPLHAFVWIDPDKIKEALPEMSSLAMESPTAAHTLLHRESGYVAEIIEREAMDQARSVVIDGSLRDCRYYAGEIARIRREYPHFRIGILWINASCETVYRRAERRAQVTGRHIPKAVLDSALKQVPTSFAVLSGLVDYHGIIDNDKDDEDPVFREPATLQEFASLWTSADLPIQPKNNHNEAIAAIASCGCGAYHPSVASATTTVASAETAVMTTTAKDKTDGSATTTSPSTEDVSEGAGATAKPATDGTSK